MILSIFKSFAISLSLGLGFLLQLIPLPVQLDVFRPDWVLLVLAYWSLALPNRVSIGIAFICGLVLDLTQGTTLGVHSLATCLVIFVLSTNYQRLRNYPIWQQAVMVGLLSAFYHMVLFWLQHLLFDIYFILHYLAPTVLNVVAWFYVFPLLRKWRRASGTN